MCKIASRIYNFIKSRLKQTIETWLYVSIHDIHDPGSTSTLTLLFVNNLLSITRVQETCNLNNSSTVWIHSLGVCLHLFHTHTVLWRHSKIAGRKGGLLFLGRCLLMYLLSFGRHLAQLHLLPQREFTGPAQEDMHEISPTLCFWLWWLVDNHHVNPSDVMDCFLKILVALRACLLTPIGWWYRQIGITFMVCVSSSVSISLSPLFFPALFSSIICLCDVW